MMEYLRMVLITLRQKENESQKLKFSTKLLFVSIVGVLLGTILDKLVPFNFIFNMIRGIVANITGIAIFSFGYIQASKFSSNKLKTNKSYQTIRKRLSYKQRINVSIFLGSAMMIFILLSDKKDLIFTLKTSLSISLILTIISFSRRDRNEFIKSVYNVPDLRDLEFMNKKSDKDKGDNKQARADSSKPSK